MGSGLETEDVHARPEAQARTGDVLVTGGRELSGRVPVPGNKHSMVLGFAAAVALGTTLTLENVPRLTERDALAAVLTGLGGSVTATGSRLQIDGRVTASRMPPDSARRVHGSLYLLPALVAQRGHVEFHGSGGDGLGRFDWGMARPLRHMLEVMEHFGARWAWRDGVLHARADRLRPATVDILQWSDDRQRPAGPHVSGATKTALLMAAAAPGTSLVRNPHEKEAQHELASMLRRLGIEVEQRDASWLVHGGTAHAHAEYDLMSDPAEVATWASYAAMTGSTLTLDCGETARVHAALHRELRFLKLLDIEPEFGVQDITVRPANGPYEGAELVAESTGISTDIAPLLAMLLLRATRPSTVEDRVWAGRFGYAEQLRRHMGAGMEVAGTRLLVTPSTLHSARGPLAPNDTRAAAVCLGAALATPGSTLVGGIAHLDRGYQELVPRLVALGARIERTAGPG
jgi:UDP-N-acetylglucosamine 1-carboxyvinyltransferase